MHDAVVHTRQICVCLWPDMLEGRLPDPACVVVTTVPCPAWGPWSSVRSCARGTHQYSPNHGGRLLQHCSPQQASQAVNNCDLLDKEVPPAAGSSPTAGLPPAEAGTLARVVHGCPRLVPSARNVIAGLDALI